MTSSWNFILIFWGVGGDFRKQEHLFVLKQYLELIEAKESSRVVHVIIRAVIQTAASWILECTALGSHRESLGGWTSSMISGFLLMMEVQRAIRLLVLLRKHVQHPNAQPASFSVCPRGLLPPTDELLARSPTSLHFTGLLHQTNGCCVVHVVYSVHLQLPVVELCF